MYPKLKQLWFNAGLMSELNWGDVVKTLCTIRIPEVIWRPNDIALTSTRRHIVAIGTHVASFRRHAPAGMLRIYLVRDIRSLNKIQWEQYFSSVNPNSQALKAVSSPYTLTAPFCEVCYCFSTLFKLHPVSMSHWLKYLSTLKFKQIWAGHVRRENILNKKKVSIVISVVLGKNSDIKKHFN